MALRQVAGRGEIYLIYPLIWCGLTYHENEKRNILKRLIFAELP